MTARRTERPARGLPIVVFAILLGTVGFAVAVSLRYGAKPVAAPLPPGFGAPPVKSNIVIVLVDTLRPDRLGCYGYAKPTSPRIDALAAEGVLFEQAYTAAPWTLPTVVSLMTSTWPCEHGVLVDLQRLSPTLIPLAERLQTAGYATANFHANPYAGAISGLHRGFDLTQMSAPTRAAEVAPWLESIGDRPYFLYVHNVEPHDPYHVPPKYVEPFGTVSRERIADFKERSELYRTLTRVDSDAGRPLGQTDNTAAQQQALRNLHATRPQADILYDASVLWADDYVGGIIDLLKQRGDWDETLFILLADHGEEMGEHGGWQHDQSVYEELARIPLIVKLPRGRHAGTRVADGATVVDVLPTIAAALEWPELARSARGGSLLPLRAGQPPFATPRVVTMRHNRKKFFRPWKESRGDLNVAVRDGAWKAIWNVEPNTIELYDLARDPGEREDRAAEQPERVAALRRVAGQWLRECTDRAVDPEHGGMDTLDDATRRQLASLGYVTLQSAPQPATRNTTQPATTP